MEGARTKSLKGIEEKMEGLDKNSLRYQILENAKKFKTSWIDLGRALYSVWRDKLYKDWGYGSLEIYTAREIGIRKQTAMKLLRSYYFLEKEEPEYLKKDYTQATDAAVVPTYESIDVLRMAKAKKALDKEDYSNLKKEIFENGKDFREVRKDLTAMVRQREEIDPIEAAEKRKMVSVKRLLGTLKNLKREIEILKLLPSPLVKETASLIKNIEAHINA